ncbi:MAG: S41 family peptidase [bacterium]
MDPVVPLDRRFFLSAVFLLVLIALTAGGIGVYVLSDPGLAQARALTMAALTIKRHHYDRISGPELLEAARREIFSRLDRYSAYIDQAHLEQIREELSGHYSGIGVIVIYQNRGLRVVSVREDGPAGKAGLLSGDVIIAADSVSFNDLDADDASSLLRGEAGTSVLVRLHRPVSGDTVEMDITRESISLLHIPFAGYTPDSLVYIRLLDFEAGTTDDLRSALDSLVGVEDSVPRARGIILDLRGNPGGLFDEAYRTADLFLEKGIFIVGTDARSRWHRRRFYATGEDVTGGLPLAIIVDDGSASSAEIVAGALQQVGRAVLVGDTTFGKGLVQGFTSFPEGDGLRLTIARYYFEGGIFLNDFDSTLNDTGHGLVPDHYYTFDEIHPFVLALRSSLLMQQFAHEHQDEIIAAAGEGVLGDEWLSRFVAYAESHDFHFRSRVEAAAELFADIVAIEPSSPHLRRITERLLVRADRESSGGFDDHAAFIKRQLKRLAWERKSGTYAAYREAVVTQRPVLKFVARLLTEEH